MDAFKTNTEFPRLASGPGSSIFVEIPQIFSNCVVLYLFMAFHLLLLLFLPENVADRDKSCFFHSPTPDFHICILLWGQKFQQCFYWREPQGRASSAECRCSSLTLRHRISASSGCLSQVLFQRWSLWVQQEVAESPRVQPRPLYQGRTDFGMNLVSGHLEKSLAQVSNVYVA